MRTVLFITYYYPPSVDAGAKRAEGFARYLPEHGYEPIVLTVRDGNYQTAGTPAPPDGPGIIRVPERTFLPSRSRANGGGAVALPRPPSAPARLVRRLYREAFHQPDAYWGFHRPALRQALEIVARQRVDAVLTTSSPFTLLHTGQALRARTGLPWVADLRDLWVHSHLGYPYSRLRRFIDARQERRWLSAASRLTTATEGLIDVLRQAGYGDRPMDCVPNGFFDPPPVANGAGSEGPELRLCYTGTLHERGGHTAAPLFEALARLPPPAAVRAVFYGAVNTDFGAQVARYRLSETVSFGGRLTREEAQRRQQEADVLLVILPEAPGQKATLPSKTFDYLAARRAILAIVPLWGETAALLRKVGVTRVFAPADVEGIARALADMAEAKRRLGRVPAEADPEAVAGYHYRHLTGRLARALDAAVASS
ncbi:MAG TPA: glycosyltransferase family 4 protein [Vicinamibacteria bacterium]